MTSVVIAEVGYGGVQSCPEDWREQPLGDLLYEAIAFLIPRPGV